jgi:hypothetical protein
VGCAVERAYVRRYTETAAALISSKRAFITAVMTGDAVTFSHIGIEMRRAWRVTKHILIHIVAGCWTDSHTSLQRLSGEETTICGSIVEIVVGECRIQWKVHSGISRQAVAVLVLCGGVGHGRDRRLVRCRVAH